jgi:hypothetical protein
MKKYSIFLVVLALSCLVGTLQAQTATCLDPLKALVGQWEGTGAHGTSQASYQSISNGTALMETVEMGGENMVTTIYPDGNRLMLTHYCSANNQPRMQSDCSGGGKTYAFSFVDATNLASPDAGHMKGVVITITDNDHFSEAWTWTEKGQEKTETFQFSRKK